LKNHLKRYANNVRPSGMSQCLAVWAYLCNSLFMIYFEILWPHSDTSSTTIGRTETRKPKKLCRLISLKIYEIKAQPGWRIKI